MINEEIESYFKEHNFKVEIVEEIFDGYQIFMVAKKIKKEV